MTATNFAISSKKVAGTECRKLLPLIPMRRSSEVLGGSTIRIVSPLTREQHHSFWDWLFGNDLPEHDRIWYHSNLREGRTALSVLARSDAERERVADVLEEFNPLDMHDETTAGIGGATRISPEQQQ